MLVKHDEAGIASSSTTNRRRLTHYSKPPNLNGVYLIEVSLDTFLHYCIFMRRTFISWMLKEQFNDSKFFYTVTSHIHIWAPKFSSKYRKKWHKRYFARFQFKMDIERIAGIVTDPTVNDSGKKMRCYDINMTYLYAQRQWHHLQ